MACLGFPVSHRCLTRRNAFRVQRLMGSGVCGADISIGVTFLHLLATTCRCFIEVMTRRTFRLPPNIDRALAHHAKEWGAKPSAIARDALASYLVMEGNTQRMNVELEALRVELRAGLRLIHERLAALSVSSHPVGVNDITDRVRARFDQITHKEEPNGNRND